MKVKKGNREVEVKDEIQLSAFVNSGWVLVEEKDEKKTKKA